LKVEDVALGDPGPTEVRVRHEAIGVNYIDIYHRTGLYPLPLPSGIGAEACGIVETIGSRVERFKVGERVAYATGGIGAYAEARLAPEQSLIKVPDGLDPKIVAACLLKGMTAEYLIHRTFNVMPKQKVLFHAAAGGVGHIAVQWLKHIGATVIGTVGSEEKIEIAKRAGCDHVIDYRKEDFTRKVRDITRGHGVPVVYDSVGRDTFEKSLDCLSVRGLLVSFGNASGKPPLVDLLVLSQKGSLYITRATLFSYVAERKDLEASAAALFDAIAKKHITITIGQTFRLEEAAKAHEALESRKTTGSTILLP
jgi:NADPH2:quinone reductase